MRRGPGKTSQSPRARSQPRRSYLNAHRLPSQAGRCETCGLSRLDPLPRAGQLAAHYEQRAERGNYEPEKAPERAASFRDVLDFAERCGARRGRVFDVGCFDGGFDLAAERGWEGWGLELQKQAASVAERRHPGRIFSGTVEEFSGIQPQYFDLITAIGLVEHLRDPRRLFSIAKDGLRRGGLLVIQTPDLRSIPARLLGRFWPPIAPPEHTYYFDRVTLPLISRRYGLAPVRTRPNVNRLRLSYVHDQFQHFGPEFHRLLGPLMGVLPQGLKGARVPLYGGEILFAAVRVSG